MSLQSISPIDGRYKKHTQTLSPIFSEWGFMRYRIIVEGEYLIALSVAFNSPPFKGGARGGYLRKFSDKEKKKVRDLYNLTPKDAEIISDIEFKGYKQTKPTQHDVKAVEYYMKDKLAGTSLKDVLEWIHFALTSEDTNNLAYGLMLKDGLSDVIIPKIEEIIKSINQLISQSNNLPMLARTHGQSASPTTFGKEFKVFAERIQRQLNKLKSQEILVKLNGATGNYNAHVAAFPKVNWINFTKNFITNLNKLSFPTPIGNLSPGSRTKSGMTLQANLHTTQIEPHDSYIEIFDTVKHINTILIDFNQDIWRYISDGYMGQKAVAGEVGSSTMPHKINPIKFENSEGNLGLSNSLFEFFARKLPISRLQRDLTDSTVQRNFGTAFAHSLIAYNYLLDGLSRIKINEHVLREDLNNHSEVIAEAIQTVLRREGIAMPYEQLKELTRGHKVTIQDFSKFIDRLNVPDKIKQELKRITPENYTGLASKLASL